MKQTICIYRKLDKTEKGKDILNCFMEFIHRNTKQDGNFHVVLASSSSLFVRRIMKDSLSRSSIAVGDDIIDEMIKEHVVCYRPGPVWNDDLDLHKNVKFLIITAPTSLHLYVYSGKETSIT